MVRFFCANQEVIEEPHFEFVRLRTLQVCYRTDLECKPILDSRKGPLQELSDD